MKTIINKNKSDFIKSLSKEQFDNGLVKFDIVDETLCSESVWGWIPPEYAEKYYRGELCGTVKVILLNHTLTLFGKVNYGDEVEVIFNGRAIPKLNLDWVKENL
jgi:hypothetical protein